MKRKIYITLISFIVLVLCTLGAWLYSRQADNSTFSSFIKTLKQNGSNVKDVTKEYPKNQKVLVVDGIDIFISIEKYISGIHNFYSNCIIILYTIVHPF